MEIPPHGTEKVATGIAGFDEISCGGIPESWPVLIMGEAGAGKTAHTLHVLTHVACIEGIAALFAGLLEEGFQRNAMILLTWDPGSGRMSLAAASLETAYRRGEQAVCLVLEQSPAYLVQCLGRAGIRLDPQLKSGLLHTYDATPDRECEELQAWRIQELVEHHRPGDLGIDPPSSAMNTAGAVQAGQVAERLMTFARSRGIAAIYTSLPQKLDHACGERSRALGAVTSRCTFTSIATHDVLRRSGGVSMRKVFVRGHRVLSREYRQEEEMRQRAEIVSWQNEIERMSAQLVVEKRAVESLQEEHLLHMAGDMPPRQRVRSKTKVGPGRVTVKRPLRAGKKGAIG